MKKARKRVNLEWTRKKRLSSDTEVGKLFDRWRIRNILEPLVLGPVWNSGWTPLKKPGSRL
jgi:hypothetical protein